MTPGTAPAPGSPSTGSPRATCAATITSLTPGCSRTASSHPARSPSSSACPPAPSNTGSMPATCSLAAARPDAGASPSRPTWKPPAGTAPPAPPTSTATPTRRPAASRNSASPMPPAASASSPTSSTHGHNGATSPPGEVTPDGCGSTSPPPSSAPVSSGSPAHTSSPPTSKPKPHNAWKGKQYEARVPVLMGRCHQQRVRHALEPEWEARFEPRSYGFRPGRSCHDAIAAIYQTCKGPMARRVWALDADLAAAFDRIDHDHLLAALGSFPSRDLIRGWLKAGVFEPGKGFAPTVEGTPQGGVISPCLLNVALHGLEVAAGVRYRTSGTHAGEARPGSPGAIRYSDDGVPRT